MIKTSPTKLETYDLCARKWWLTYVEKLPRVMKGHFGFGTILHAACERHLQDQPLWPEGWDIDPDTKHRIVPSEAALIQVLVQEGIDSGTIERRSGGEVEKWIEIEVDEEVTLRGLIDYHSMKHARIEDHKTSKSARYFKSTKALKSNIQMMSYGKWMLDEYLKKGELPPRIFTLCHNQFLKDFDSPLTQKREAEVTPAEIQGYWDKTIMELIGAMKETAKVEDPFDIPDPEVSACRAFGGCDFCSICGGQEDRLQYRSRIDSINKKTAPEETKKMTMTPEQFLAARNKTPADAPEAVVNPPAPAATAVAEESQVEANSPPPWANPECSLCAKGHTPGFNAKGKPCRICLAVTKVDIKDYDYSLADGTTKWWKKGEEAPVAEAQAPPVEDKGTKIAYSSEEIYESVRGMTDAKDIEGIVESAKAFMTKDELKMLAQVASAKLAEITTPPAKEEKPKPKPVVAEAASERKAAAPAVPDGLVLLIGCAPLKWPGATVVFAEDVLRRVDGYWDNLKAFERREQVRRTVQAGGDFIDSLSGTVIVQQGRDPDMDNLMSSLLPFATTVIRGTIQ